MTTSRKRGLITALAAAALFAATSASADLVYLPGENSSFSGAGLGTVNTVLTLGSNSSTVSGAVTADGTGFATSGDAFTGASQVGLPTLGALGISDPANLRIIFNAVEPAGDSITIDTMDLTFYDATGLTSSTFSLAAAVAFPSTFTGVGQAGFVFGLDSTQAGEAATFISGSGTLLANIRVGLSSSLSDVAGGHETFFIANAQVTPVPEPSTYALMLAGLGGIGFVIRRRLS